MYTNPKITAIVKHDHTNICGFFGPYRWLSNYHLCEVMYDGVVYPSSENAFQAAKALPEDRWKFVHISPKEAKSLGKTIPINVGVWGAKRLDVMYAILLDKFTRNKDLLQALLDTGNRYLEETNWWNDVFWGVCNGFGCNNLGNILMTIRAEAKKGTIDSL